MFKAIRDILFSMKMMTTLVFIFFLSIGTATFIENDFGTPAAKQWIYNARWFEVVIFLLVASMMYNIYRYNLLRKEKISVLTFHVAFIVIVLGAAITRYISFEGMMRIREGEASNLIVSDDTFLQIKVDDGKMQYSFDKKLFLNNLANKAFEHAFTFEGRQIKVAYKDYIPNAKDTLIPAQNGSNFIELVIPGKKGREYRYLKENEVEDIGNIIFSFNHPNPPKGSINITKKDNQFFIQTPFEIGFMRMSDQSQGVIDKDTLQEFAQRQLYTLGGLQFVFSNYQENVEIKMISGDEKQNPQSALILDVATNNETREITLLGGKGFISGYEDFNFSELHFLLSYGSKYYVAPFFIQLNDFQLERYPGSMSPSSFASEVTLIDRNENLEMPYRIYMNNVLDYKGYRFFQSSYDEDEMGSILSVNHDFWGTTISYLGYSLLALGMILTLFNKNSRFTFLGNNIKKIRERKTALILFFTLGISTQTFSFQPDSTKALQIDKSHAEKFSLLLIQDQGGRVKPLHTYCSEVMRKVYGNEKYKGLNSSQMVLSMLLQPQYWQREPMIKISHPELKKKIGIAENEKYATLINFFDEQFRYKLEADVEAANLKKPALRNKYDKDVIAVDERVNVCYMVYSYEFMRIFPKPNDANNTWLSPNQFQHNFKGMDSLFVRGILSIYLESVFESSTTGNWGRADTTLGYIKSYQNKFGAAILPSQSKVDWEIRYNKQLIFKNLFYYYFTVGFILLIVLFVQVFRENKVLQILSKIFTLLLAAGFAFHIYGLALRWYISGHAPWSNAYESMIYIAFATMLSGFIFSKSSKIALAATALLASLILMVAHLNWLDPEITNLVPVLNSYWLMIHVAIITGSYGFLGLGCLLALICLVMMIFRNSSDENKINLTLKELTYINEMTITVGLFMLTIGTFLGGVWANESWGRYWGWDPKETWAMATVLMYTFVLHLRFIPAFKNAFTFNFWSLWAYSSVIMTYFGVNYYLSGLHSYAKGDPVPIPTFVYYTVAIFGVISILAYIRHKKIGKITIG